MKRLTLDQAIVVSGYTGFLACNFSDLNADVNRRLGRPVFADEFPALKAQIRAAYRDDFLRLCIGGTPMPDKPPVACK